MHPPHPQGPLAKLECASIALGRAARAPQQAAAAHGDGAPQPWLPIALRGLRLRVAPKPRRSSSSKPRRAPPKLTTGAGNSLVQAAVAWPVSMGLQLGSKVLPRMPVDMEDLTIELEGPGVELHLKHATATFEPAGSGEQLQLTVMAHHFALRAAAAAGSAQTGDGQQQQQPGVSCPAIKVVCAVSANRGLLPVAITLVDIRVGEILVSDMSDLLVQLAHAGTAGGGKKARGGAISASAAAKAPKPPPDVLKLLQLLPTKAKVSLAGVRLEDTGGGGGSIGNGADAVSAAGLPAFVGHVGPLQVSLSSAPAQLLRAAPRGAAGEAAGKVVVAAVSLGAVQLKVSPRAAAAAGTGAAAAEQAAAAAAAAAPACVLSTEKATATLELGREFAAAAPDRRQPRQPAPRLHVQLLGSCSADLHAPKALLREAALPRLVAALSELSARTKAAKAAKHAAQLGRAQTGGSLASARSLGHELSCDGSGQLLPSPASSVASVNALSPAVAAAMADESPSRPESAASAGDAGDAGGRAPRDGGSGSSAESEAEAAAAAAAGALVELRWQSKFTNHGGVNVEMADASSEICHWLCLTTLEGTAAGSMATAGGPAASLHAGLQARQLAVRCRPAVEAPSAASPQLLVKLLTLDTVDLCVSSAEEEAAPATAAGEAEGEGAAAAAATPVVRQEVPLLLSVSANALVVAASQALLQPLAQLAMTVVGSQPPRRSSKTAGGADAAAGGGDAFALAPPPPPKIRKPKVFKLASIGAALQSLRCSYTAPLPVLPAFGTAGDASVPPPPCDPSAAAVSIELAAAGVKLTAQLPPRKLLTASLQLLTLDSRTVGTGKGGSPAAGAAAADHPLQSCRLLQLGSLEARLHDRPAMQLVKVFCGQLHSHVHVDAVLAPLGAVVTLLQSAADAKQRAAAALSSSSADGAAVGSGRRASPAPPPCPSPTPPPATPFAARPPRPSAPSGSPSRRLRRPLHFEGRLQDLSASVSVCESDSIQLDIQLLKASSVLEQAVVERLAAGMSGRDVVVVNHLTVGVLRAPLASQPGLQQQQQQQQQPDAWSPGRDSSVASPGRGPGGFSGYAGAAEAAGAPRQLLRPAPAQAQHGVWACVDGVRLYEDGGPQTGASVDDALPSSGLGSRRGPGARDAAARRRQEARQAAARDRCCVPAGTVHIAPPPPSSASSWSQQYAGAGASPSPVKTAAAAGGEAGGAMGAPDPVAAGSTAAAAAAAAAGGILSLDVYAEHAVFSVPHDQSIGRLIVVAETWSKAVKQVVKAHAADLKSALSGLKSPGARPKAPKPKKAKLAYLELVAEAANVVFALEQHPLERWMALHAPALQAVTAQRHLSEQLVSSIAISKRGSRTGNSGGGQPGAAAGAAGGAAAAVAPAAAAAVADRGGEEEGGDGREEELPSADEDSSDDEVRIENLNCPTPTYSLNSTLNSTNHNQRPTPTNQIKLQPPRALFLASPLQRPSPSAPRPPTSATSPRPPASPAAPPAAARPATRRPAGPRRRARARRRISSSTRSLIWR
jgi:hypothetical protein